MNTLRFLAGLLLAASMQGDSWRGWNDAVTLRNPKATVVVVPSIGRIMQFSLTGQEGPFWSDRSLDGKPIDPDWQREKNFGGDKSVPERMADWPKMIGRIWPPPAAFDAARYTAEVKDRQITLTSPVDPAYGI